MVWRESGHISLCEYLCDHLYDGNCICVVIHGHEQLSDCPGLFRPGYGDRHAGSRAQYRSGSSLYLRLSYGSGRRGCCDSPVPACFRRLCAGEPAGKKNAHKAWLGRLREAYHAENRKLWLFPVSDYRQRQYPADCAEYGAAALRRSGRGRYSGYLRHHCAELSIVDYYAHERHYPGQSAGGQL